MDFYKLILTPFIWVLNAFYTVTGSYGLALILFAIVVKAILFPFQLKGKKGMIQMNLLSGKMQQLQKAYGKDRERYNQEVQKLYEREKVNPMSGCLWSFLPIFILIPLYSIIREPLYYLMDVSRDALPAIADAVNWGQAAFNAGFIKEAGAAFVDSGYNQLYLASFITPDNLSAVQAVAGEGARVFAINFDFLHIFDLSRIPVFQFWTVEGGFALFLLPVISAGSSVIFSLISQKTNAVNQQASQANNSTMRTMLIITPLISLWIGFTMPAALCLYWIIQNILSMGTEFISGKLLKKDYEEAAARRAEQERLEKEEEKERKRKQAEERARRAEELKNAKGKKKKELLTSMEKESKGDSAVISVSGVGMRSYARGRAYDPYRFSPDGPTPYHDPDRDWDEAKSQVTGTKKDSTEEPAAVENQDTVTPEGKVKRPAEEPVSTEEDVIVENQEPQAPVTDQEDSEKE